MFFKSQFQHNITKMHDSKKADKARFLGVSKKKKTTDKTKFLA